MKANSYKIFWLIVMVSLIIAIPLFYKGYEAFNSNLVGNRNPDSFGFLGITGPRTN